MNAVDPIRAAVRMQRHKARDAAAAFASAIANCDQVAIRHAMQAMQVGGSVRAGFRLASRLAKVPPPMQAAMLDRWIQDGDTIRDAVNDDAVLLDALRVLLPPYAGPAMTLYRGDSAHNRQRRTYGPSWSADMATADGFARGMWRMFTGGSVLLRATVLPAAILCQVHGSAADGYQEAEYLVDRRRLKGVQVLNRYDQVEVASLKIEETAMFVWKSVGTPGKYGFAEATGHADFDGPDWQFVGGLNEAGLPDHVVETVTGWQLNGHSRTAHVDRNGSFIV